MKASQGLISGALLLAIRQTEAQRGTLLAHHGRHPAALRPTQTRQNAVRSAARHEARQRARYIEHVNVQAQRGGLKLAEAERLCNGSLGGFEFV